MACPYLACNSELRTKALSSAGSVGAIFDCGAYILVQATGVGAPSGSMTVTTASPMPSLVSALANRRAFDDRLADEIRRSKRYDHPFTLVMMDINKFKAVNDTFGHLVGDQTLQKVAFCLLNSVRDTDFVARYGGDEFALILPETSKENAAILIEKIRNNLKTCKMPWPENDLSLSIDAASGAASFPEDASTAIDLIAVADQGLYRHKKQNQ